MASQIRITIAVARVLREFLANVHRPRYGYDLMQVTGYPSGKLYPILARLVEAGWLIREQEDIDCARAGRPARYLYRLNEEGAQATQRALAAISEQLAPPASEQLAPPRRPQSDLAPQGIYT
jgi:DNA-binding PadR family transcriptional regulator